MAATSHADIVRPCNFTIQRPFCSLDDSQGRPAAKAVDGISKQAEEFVGVIRQSVEVAQDGHTLTGDAISFCDFRMGRSGKQSAQSLSSMIYVANLARTRTQHIHRSLQDIHTELNKAHHLFHPLLARDVPLFLFCSDVKALSLDSLGG
jgi:hypothetical protein